MNIYQRDNNPIGMKMSGQGHSLVFNERQGSPHTTREAAAGHKTSLYTDTVKELLLYSQLT